MKKILRITLETNDPVDSKIWDYLKGISDVDQLRTFIRESMLLNMSLPPLYHVVYLSQLAASRIEPPTINSPKPTGIPFEPVDSTPVPDNPILGLSRDSFKL